MIDTQDELQKDMEAVKQIPIVPMMLEVICRTTGMGFATVARVTDDRWLACSVRDEVNFGLVEGGELKLETTICNEIKDSHQPVIIDHVDEDEAFRHHHTPKMYGLQSYISFPIILKNGQFFGTLCAIDSKPAKVNTTAIIGTFKLFAELLAFHLDTLITIEEGRVANVKLNEKNKQLERVNSDLENFVYTTSHDLKSPISNIDGLINALSEVIEEDNQGMDKQQINELIDMMKVSVDRFAGTLKDLTNIIRTRENMKDHAVEAIHLPGLIEDVKLDVAEMLAKSNGSIELIVESDTTFYFSKKNFKSIVYNLVSNALKYRSPERIPRIVVKTEKVDNKLLFSVKDNGLGLAADKKDKVFTMFQRFHSHIEGTGIGLYIVKKMIEEAGGKIEIESEEGVGTEFKLYLKQS